MKTTGERGNVYGKPLKNHILIGIKWSVTVGVSISPTKVAWMVGADLKSAREIFTPSFDNTLDDIGYAVCRDAMALQVMEMRDFFAPQYKVQSMPDLTYDWALEYLHRMTLTDMTAMLEYMWENDIV